MWPYFLLTGCIALAAILFPSKRPDRVVWAAAYVAIVLFTGLRHHVGMDWNNYLRISHLMAGEPFIKSFSHAEPAYAILLWSSTHLGFGVYGANLIGAIIFCAGLFKLAGRTPLPWVALATALPVLVIVVSMSANRQTIAIGLLLWLAAVWDKSSLWKRVAFTLAASAFHFSAIFFLGLIAWDTKMRPGVRMALALLLIVGMVQFIGYTGAGDYYDRVYVSQQTDLTFSPGATQHVMFNGLPALFALLNRHVREHLLPSVVLVQMAVLAAVLIPVAFFYSTAADRMSLYLFPVSMFVLSSLPGLIPDVMGRAVVRTAFGVFMCAVLAYWLTFANTSYAHIPYRNALTVDSWQLQT